MKFWEMKLALLFVLHHAMSFDWTNFPGDNEIVYSIIGDNVTFPWSYHLSQGEHIDFTQYFFNSSRLVAIDTHGMFIPQGHYSSRVLKHPPAGLELKHVTEADSGRYTIMVEGNTDTGAAIKMNKTVNLVVGQKPGDFLQDIVARLTNMELHSNQLETKLAQVEYKLNQSETELSNFKSKSEIETSKIKLNLSRTEAELLREKTKIAFQARGLTDGSLTSNQLMHFNSVDVNIGNGYNNNTGLFTAPTSGLYYFSAMTQGKASGYVGLYIARDDVMVSAYSDSYSGNQWESVTSHTLCHLHQSQTVGVHVTITARYDGNLSSFMGFLISSD